jgi:hypothetical protein
MTTKTEPGEIHELAGGWISERKGTPVPPFLKLAYLGFSAFGLVYLFLYAAGEVSHDSRGALVRQFNAASDMPGSGWIAFMAAWLVLFAGGLVWYALLRKPEADE